MGLPTERPACDLLCPQAIRSAPAYEPYYHSRAIFLLPRWYGTGVRVRERFDRLRQPCRRRTRRPAVRHLIIGI